MRAATGASEPPVPAARPAGGLTFEPLHYADRLRVVNPAGDVGLVTLWSPRRTVERKLDAISPAILDPARSRVAVVANLYGDGMFAMFCNLLHNPQVRHMVALGQDLGLGTSEEIAAFLEHGLEDARILGRPVKRIAGTARLLPDVPGFDAARLRRRLTFHDLGKLSSPRLDERLVALLDTLPRHPAVDDERIRVALPADTSGEDTHLPSNVAGHQVIRRSPLDCWEELVVRVMRFGPPIELRNGPRRELLNVKAVITDPQDDPPAALERFGFSLDRFRAYQEGILRPDLPEGISYTYGNRLRGHFGAPVTDTLDIAIAALRADPRTRGAYVSLWDTAIDLRASQTDADAGATPCLTTIFFRVAEARLTLTATYRAHNLLTAWLQNVYGLMAIQRHVAEAVGMEMGPITVLSHSLGIDPRSPRYDLARTIADGWTRDDDVDRSTGKFSLREDPNGYFVVSVDHDRGRIVADRRFGGVLVKRYEADRAATIEQQVSADMAVTLVSHALWLGRELARHEQLLHGDAR